MQTSLNKSFSSIFLPRGYSALDTATGLTCTSRKVVNAFLHASGWSRAETLEFRIAGHVAEIGAVTVALYTLVHDRLLVLGPYRPVGKEAFTENCGFEMHKCEHSN
jgi:hypothetical protein